VRRILCLLLILFLPLHVFAMQGRLSSVHGGANVLHKIDHMQHKAHYHDDDGAIHYDQSDKSIKHVADHECSQQTAALPTIHTFSSNLISFPKDIVPLVVHIPDVYIKSPQRPPSIFG
jgi:hypothetical protein